MPIIPIPNDILNDDCWRKEKKKLFFGVILIYFEFQDKSYQKAYLLNT